MECSIDSNSNDSVYTCTLTTPYPYANIIFLIQRVRRGYKHVNEDGWVLCTHCVECYIYFT